MFILVFFLVILVLVIVHELGHFLAAKKFNIKVLEFGFGIPPRIFGKKVGETLVSLNWLPFGGFVRLLGEDEVNKKLLEDKRSFASQKVQKRIMVVVAGVAMNFILAWILFWVSLGMQGFKSQLPLLLKHDFIGAEQKEETIVLIGAVAGGSPAQKSGIKAGDRVIAVNNDPIGSSDELIGKTKDLADTEITITLSDLQKNNLRAISVTPRKDPPKGEGPLGISLGTFKIVNLFYSQAWQKLLSGPIHSINIAVYSMKILGYSVSAAQTEKRIEPLASNFGGPIAIGYTIKEVLQSETIVPFIELVASISLVLAVMNVLPIPALDGGRLFFLAVEAVIKKRVPAHIEAKIHAAGMVLLLTLFILVTYKDIRVYILNLSPF